MYLFTCGFRVNDEFDVDRILEILTFSLYSSALKYKRWFVF